MNLLVVTGRVGSDVYFKQMRSGNNLARLRIGIPEKKKDKDTVWTNISVAFWGKQADVIQKYIQKGSWITVIGSLVENTREKDGEQITQLEISGQRFEFVGEKSGGKKESRDGDRDDMRDAMEDDRPKKKSAPTPKKSSSKPPVDEDAESDEGDNDIPFDGADGEEKDDPIFGDSE